MTDQKTIARYFIAEAFNTGNLAPADELIAADFVNHDRYTTAADRAGGL